MTKSQNETGWVVEVGSSDTSHPTYLAGPHRYTTDHLKAVRFARKEDAEKFALKTDRVCEHAWD